MFVSETNNFYQEQASIVTGEVKNSELQNKNPEMFFDAALIQQTAEIILTQSLKIKPGEKLHILGHRTGWQLASAVMHQARKVGAEVHFRFFDDAEVTDPVLETLSAASEPGGNKVSNAIIDGLRGDQINDVNWANKFLIIRNKIKNDVTSSVNVEIKKLFDQAQSQARRLRNDDPEKSWALIYVPNQEEAVAAGMTLQEYSKFYFEAITTRDWPEVKKAQGKLVEKLKGKKTFQVTSPGIEGFPADWKTDISMSIEGMVAANSTIEKNLPGSEVYLAPVANTIEGSYAIPYQVSFKERVLPNLKLVFKQGVLTEYDVYYADENDPRKKTDLEYIEKTLGIDEGSRKIGELGIGTNPHIRKSFINTILIEKAVGVHLALGNSYANNYDGQDINIDNGNRSANHIDIALIMLPEFGGGEMIVDGEVIQKDGVFLDPELAVLNH